MQVEIIIDVEDKDVIYKAIKPDIEDDISLGNSLNITIYADKISDLRAKINSYLRLCEVVLRCIRS
ncbi:MAG: KEOPS complex subunit Pcc1 [Candidatus Nitrosocaldaceae archaeon]